jgi:hypothetical protein
MSPEKEKKLAKAPAKPKKAVAKAAATETKPKVAAKPKAAAAKKAPAPVKKAAAPAKTATKSAVAAGIPKATAPIAASKSGPSYEQIAHVAYGYFLQRHGQHGHHDQDWFRAEQELRELFKNS